MYGELAKIRDWVPKIDNYEYFCQSFYIARGNARHLDKNHEHTFTCLGMAYKYLYAMSREFYWPKKSIISLKITFVENSSQKDGSSGV